MKTQNKNLLKALAAVAVASLFPVAANSMAGVTTNNGITFTFTPTVSAGIGGSQTLTATNSSGILTNGTAVSATGVIAGPGTTGITDTAMSVYGFGTKVTASTKGFVLYEQSTAAATLSAAVASNNLVQFSITAAAGTDIYLTNASGWGYLSGGATCVSNWGFVYSSNGPINASSSGGVGGSSGWTAIGGTGSVAANATNVNIASSGGWGTALTGGANNLKISAGSTYYFALVYWGATSTGASSTALSANSFVLNAYDVVTSSGSLQYWIGGASGNWNTTASSWSTNSSGTPAGTFSQNDSAYITNASTIALTNTGITANGLTVSNSSGTVALSGGSLTSSNLVKAAAGTLTLGMSNTLGTVTISSGTVGIGANNQGAGAVTVNGSSLTGSGTVTGTSFSASNSTISASLAGNGASLTLNGTGVIGVATQTTNSISGNNTFTGNTTINGGRTLVGSGTAFGTGTIILAGSTATQQVLDLNGQTLANNITNSGTAFSTASTGNGQIINSATGSATLTGNLASSANFQVTVGSVYDGTAAQIASNGGSITLSGNISIPSKVLSKNGVGTLTLSGSNTIGTLSAGDGVINAVGTNSLGGGILTGFGSATNTGTLNLATQAAYKMNSINVGGAVRVNSTTAGTSLEFTNTGATANISVGTANKNFYTDSNTAVTFDGGFEYGGTTATKGSRTINFYNEGAITIQGPVAYTDPLSAGNSGYISKQGGNGTLTFNGANTLAQQASIQQGTVMIGAASSLGTYGGVILGGSNSSTLDLSALQSSGYSLTAATNQITNNLVSNSYAGNTLILSTTNTVTNTVSSIRGNGTINIGTGTITSDGISPSWYNTVTTTNQSGVSGTYTTTQALYTNTAITKILGNLAFDSTAVTTLDIESLSQAGNTNALVQDGYDQIQINGGTLAYNGTLNINSPSSLAVLFGGATKSVVLFSGMTSVTGDLSNLYFNAGSSWVETGSGASGVFSYTDAGTTYTFTQATGTLAEAVPEPGTCAMVGLGLSALAVTIVRRRRSND